jgi:hypothetical protein
LHRQDIHPVRDGADALQAVLENSEGSLRNRNF